MSDKEVKKEASGSKNVETVKRDETNKVEANIDAQKMTEKIERMKQLKLKLKTAKGKVTEVLKKN